MKLESQFTGLILKLIYRRKKDLILTKTLSISMYFYRKCSPSHEHYSM